MPSIYSMKVLIDAAEFPELHAKLSEARHPRARAEMLRRLASTYLTERARISHAAVTPTASVLQTPTTVPSDQARSPARDVTTDSRLERDPPQEITDRFVGNMGRFLVGNE